MPRRAAATDRDPRYGLGASDHAQSTHRPADLSPTGDPAVKTPQHDPHELQRFVDAQLSVYDKALCEIRQGQKRSHWMWYLFPQFIGLGTSTISRRYAIRSRDEAIAYLDHPLLGPRLTSIADAVLELRGLSATAIFGSPDDLKLRSSATLFAAVSPHASTFHRLLEQYFNGEPDPLTLELLGRGVASN